MPAADHRWQHPAHVGRPPHSQLRQVVPPAEHRHQAGVNEPPQVAGGLARGSAHDLPEPGGPHGGELAGGQEQPVGQPAVDGRHVWVLPQPDARRSRPAHAGMSGGVRHQVPGGTEFHHLAALPVGGAEQRGCRAGQGVAGQLPGPGVMGHHDLARRFHRLVVVLVEDPVADAEISVLLVGVAVNAPESVLLLAPESPLGGVQAGVGEGGPKVRSVACHGVVKAAAAQQPEVGHTGRPGFRRVVGRPDHPPAAQQVRGQGVDRLQHGQAAQGGLDTPGRGGPGRVLVAGFIPGGILLHRTCDGEGRVALVLQVGRVVVVQGEPLPVVLRQFPLGVESGLPCGPCFFPGRRMLVVGDVEQVHGPAGQEPAVLPPLGHAPHHRGNPTAPPQDAQYPPYFLFVQTQHRAQVGHAGQRHPGSYPQQASFIVVQRLPRRHRRTSVLPWDKSRWLVPTAGKPEPGSGAWPTGPHCGGPAALLGDAPLYVSGSGHMVLGNPILNLRMMWAGGLQIPSGDALKRTSRAGDCAFRQGVAGIYSSRSGQELGKGLGTVNRKTSSERRARREAVQGSRGSRTVVRCSERKSVG